MEKSRDTKSYLGEAQAEPGVTFPVNISDPKERVQAYIDSYQRGSSNEGFDEDLMRNQLKVVHAVGGPEAKVVFEMKITPAYCNRLGNMHGGAMALVHDMCTTATAAPAAKKGFWEFGGVSRVLSVTYLRPAKVGTTVRIECEIIQMGARLATIRGVIKDKSSGKTLSIGEHNKASIPLAETPNL